MRRCSGPGELSIVGTLLLLAKGTEKLADGGVCGSWQHPNIGVVDEIHRRTTVVGWRQRGYQAMGVREVVRARWCHRWAKVVPCVWTGSYVTVCAVGQSGVMIRLWVDIWIGDVGG